MNKLEKISQRIYHIKFDDSAIEKLYATQNDTKSRSYLFKFQTGSGEMVDFSGITLEMTIQIGEKKQTVMGELVSPEEGTYKVTLPSSALQIAGKAQGQLILIDTVNQAKLQTRNFSLIISPSLEFAGSGAEGQDLWFTFSMLTDAIEETKALKSEYETSLDEQGVLHADVTEKHGQVVTMHASLAVVFDSEESRVSAEIERRSAESARQTNETERKQSETERKQSETERKQEETERKESETNRKSAEVLRGGAEVERIASELGRKQAETARVGAEEGRVTAEEERVSAEVTRVEAESGRVGAENSRSATWSTWSELMSGVMPIATSEVAGVVKVDPTQDESTPHTVMTAEKAEEKLGRKVDKVTGKGLSANDYTNAEKTKLEGIETGANNYVHPSSHPISMVAGLQAALNSKALSSHAHSVEDVTGLGAVLESKVGSSVVRSIVVSQSSDTSGLENGTLLLVVE